MPAPLLTTKLSFPPIAKYLVERPSLVEKLHECLTPGIRLVLVSAPAGFGKTTLINAWVTGLKRTEIQPAHTFAWLSLDHADNDPVTFWTYIITTLQSQREGIGRQSLKLLQMTTPPDLDGCLGLLINELAEIPNPFVLVLDDYHLIRNSTIHTSLTFLLEHMPSQFHLTLLSRTDPPLPLALLRSRGQLLQIRSRDLRFSMDEAGSFLNAGMELNLSGQAVEALNRKTEGWIAGLQLAALSIREAASLEDRGKVEEFIASFSGSNRYILDFLIEEVLNQQSEEIQNFLLKTSILDRLCSPLCNALLQDLEGSGQPESQKVLEYLDNYNLFILPLDDQRYWYRYHQLFTDLLRKRLGQIDPAIVPELHRRAAEWYEQNGLVPEAVKHAFLQEDYQKAASLISQIVQEMWGRGEHVILLEWMAALPEEEKRRYPQLWVFQVSMLITSGKMKEAERCVQEIEEYLRSSSTIDTNQSPVIGRVYSMRTYIASFYGDIPNLLRYARLALENLSQEEDAGGRCGVSLVLSNAYLNSGNLEAASQTLIEAVEAGRMAHMPAMVLSAMENLVTSLYALGDLNRAALACQEGFQLVQKNGLDQAPMVANLFINQGMILCERHVLDQAEVYIRRGLELAQARNYIWSIAWGYRALLRLLLSQGRLGEAEIIAQNAGQLAAVHEIPEHLTCGVAGLTARMWINEGKIEQSEGFLRNRNIRLDGDIQYPHESEYWALTSLCLAKGDLKSGEDLLERLLLRAELGKQRFWLTRFLALQALLFQALGDEEKSLQSLGKALELAESEGYVQTFVDEGEPMMHLLTEAFRKNIYPEYSSRLLEAFSESGFNLQFDAEVSTRTRAEIASNPGPARSGQAQSGNDILVEPLTKRETEILRLIEKGYSNKEIAQELYISLRTVKYYATNIYAKLGVSGRTQAVFKARELGIL